MVSKYLPLLSVNLGAISVDASILSSVAIILGAAFVVYQIRQSDRLLKAAVRQADSAADQAKLTLQQLTQNNDLAQMDMVMRIYEFANSIEVQSSFVTVLKSKLASFDEFEKLPEDKQLAFFQMGSLFDSLGYLMDKGFVKFETINDMFAINLGWNILKPFTMGMRSKYAAEDYYMFFEKMHEKLIDIEASKENPGTLPEPKPR